MSNPSALSVIRANWHRYRVKNPLTLRDVATGPVPILVVALLAMGATTLLLGIHLRRLWLGALLPTLLRRHMARRTAFGVFAEAVVVDGVRVPWGNVRRIALTMSARDGAAEFAVSFDEAQPRLQGLEEVAPDAEGYHLRHSTTRAFDQVKLAEALRRYAPAHLELTGVAQLGVPDGRAGQW